MLYPALRPFLFSLDPEHAHDLALRSAYWLARLTPLAKCIHSLVAHNRPISIAGLNFPNPIGLAGGMDKNAIAPAAWWAFGFGFVELGTVTPRPQDGNTGTRMWRDLPRRALFNRMGFNNDGADAVAERLSKLTFRPPFPIGMSIGKNRDTPNEDAESDYVLAARKLAPHADFVTINVSSPNTKDLRELQSPEALAKLVRATQREIGTKPLFVKLAPELSGSNLGEVLDSSLAAGAIGVIATNTLKRKSPRGTDCGESGTPLATLARQRVAEIRRHCGDAVPIIGVGGIDGVSAAKAMFEAGANLIQIYSGLVFHGPLLAASIARGLR